jgi:hypothetical protein
MPHCADVGPYVQRMEYAPLFNRVPQTFQAFSKTISHDTTVPGIGCYQRGIARTTRKARVVAQCSDSTSATTVGVVKTMTMHACTHVTRAHAVVNLRVQLGRHDCAAARLTVTSFATHSKASLLQHSPSLPPNSLHRHTKYHAHMSNDWICLHVSKCGVV